MTEPIKDRSENGWVADAGAREELLAANDATIEEATEFADPMALRGLIYQLTGDPAACDNDSLEERRQRLLRRHGTG